MFIQIDDENSSITINTDQIIWAEAGDHRNQNVTKVYLTGGKELEITHLGAKTLWKHLKSQKLDDMMTGG